MISTLRPFFNLTIRNFKIFFKNKIQVFYTLLVPILIIVIYILFLRNVELGMVRDILVKNNVTTEDATLNKFIYTLMDSWMIGGIIALSTITMAVQTDAIIVKDKENGINRDFASSPISKHSLIMSYFAFNYIVTLMLCVIVLFICWIALGCMGEFMLTFGTAMMTIGALAFCIIPSTLLTILICTFINHDNTLAAIVAIFSTAAGFVIGSYMPLGMMPKWAQSICCFFPGTYSTSLLRFTTMDQTFIQALDYLQTITSPAQFDALTKDMFNLIGYNLNFFEVSLTPAIQSVIITGFILVLGVINIFTSKNLTIVESAFERKRKRRRK